MDPSADTKKFVEKQGFTYTFLSDEKLEVIRAWDLVHPGGYNGTEDIARPAEFLLDSTGTIRWRNLTENYRVRAKAEEVLKAADDLGLGPSPK